MRSTRMLWVENCLPISSRSARIIESLRRSGRFDIAICAWSRSGTLAEADVGSEYRVYRRESPPARLVRKVANLPGYARFVRETARDYRPDVVGCSNWDMALLASLASSGKPIIYDVGDMPDGQGLYYRVGRLAERVALRRTFAVTLASRFFAEMYEFEGLRRLVVENLPSMPVPDPHDHSVDRTPRIAFVGNVRFLDTLAPLLRVADETGYPVDVHGDGAVLPALRQRHGASEHVRFHGRYRYDDLPDLYDGFDVVWAVYPADDQNVKRAISNKFFESVLFGCPGVFSRGTMLGDLVEREGIGFVVDGTSDDEIRELLHELKSDLARYHEVRDRLRAYRDDRVGTLTWPDREADVVELFMEAAGMTGMNGADRRASVAAMQGCPSSAEPEPSVPMRS